MIPLNDTNQTNSNNSINFESILESIFDRFSKGLRIIGPIFAFALTTFVLVVAHAFFNIIMPYWATKFGIVSGIILTLIAIFLLFSILFNYFLAVLVKPGNLEDLRKSKFYRKNDPLYVPSSVIDLTHVFLNKTNKGESKEDSKCEVREGDVKIKENEFKIRLKVGKASDNIKKEDLLITNANANSNVNINNNFNKILNHNNEEEKSININSNSIDINSNLDFLTDDETFEKHIENKLQSLPNLNANDETMENKSQENEINEYYGLTKNCSLNNSNNNTNNSTNNNTTRLNDCKYCKLPKIIRSHHCTICGSCVFKMDHHCPWINNCIGQNNHRYFVLFLTHTMMGCLYVCLTSLPIVFNTKITKTMEFNFVSVLSFVGFLLLVFFNSWNWFLVYRGNTTIEFWTLKANFNSSAVIRDFSMLDWKDNIFLVFGTRSLLRAIFVPSIKKLPMSGLEWTKLSIPSFNFDIIEYNHEAELRISKINNDI